MVEICTKAGSCVDTGHVRERDTEYEENYESYNFGKSRCKAKKRGTLDTANNNRCKTGNVSRKNQVYGANLI